MTRRALVSATGASVVLVALAAVAMAVTGTGPQSAPTISSDGPLRASTEHGIVAEGQTGSVFTDGFEVLQLGGAQEATIVKVESIGGSETFRHLGSQLAGPDRKIAASSYIKGFPPADDTLGELTQAEGAVIVPVAETRRSMGYELLVGYEILDDTQIGYRAGLRITYRVGDEEFVWESPARMLYCPVPQKSADCRAEAEADNWGQ